MHIDVLEKIPLKAGVVVTSLPVQSKDWGVQLGSAGYRITNKVSVQGLLGWNAAPLITLASPSAVAWDWVVTMKIIYRMLALMLPLTLLEGQPTLKTRARHHPKAAATKAERRAVHDKAQGQGAATSAPLPYRKRRKSR